MRNAGFLLIAALAALFMGCAGPEQKLGRGLVNATEFARLGEMRRAVEQTALWDGAPTRAYTTGFLRGLNRSVARTAVGLYEVVTFPIPSYDPVLTPKHRLYPDPSIKTSRFPFGGLSLSEDPAYPASFAPGILSSSTFETDRSLGFSGGDVAPMFPGSRFRIYDE